MLRLREQRSVAIIGDADGQRAASSRLAQTGESEGSGAARGDANDDIGFADRVAAHQLGAVAGLVLRAFDGFQQRVVAARHQQQ